MRGQSRILPIGHRLLSPMLQIAFIARLLLWRLNRLAELALAATFLVRGTGLFHHRFGLDRSQSGRAAANHLRPRRRQGDRKSKEFVKGPAHATQL
jgi:hypothetical protein